MPAQTLSATLHLGEVAERVDLSLRTVRYCEEQRLSAHDALGSEDAAARRAVEARVAEFAQQAVRRCEERRDDRSLAEEFAHRLSTLSSAGGR